MVLSACGSQSDTVTTAAVTADDTAIDHIDDAYIDAQRIALDENTAGVGFGPQAPRDIGSLAGTNPIVF
jgi:hypothetical protein